MLILDLKRYQIYQQVKSAKPKQNKFKIFDVETGKTQNYFELFFPSTLGKIKVVIIIIDIENNHISEEQQEIKKGNKITQNGHWKYKLRFSTPTNVELRDIKTNNFFIFK